MEKVINKHFCIQPFVNVSTRVGGQNNVCANINLQDSNIRNQSPVSFFRSDNVNDFKASLLRGEQRAECKLCAYQEKKSGHSHRTESNKHYNIKNNQSNEYYEKMLQRLRISKLENPLYFDFNVSNLCNQKCLTCTESLSSLLHEENKALGVSRDKNANYTTLDKSKLRALESAITDDLLFLHLVGGEILLVPEVKEILEKVDRERAGRITLQIQTNGTIIPDREWHNIIKKFKRTEITIGIPAFGEDINYIGYPADWKKILATIDHFKQHKINFVIGTVVSNLNIMILDKLFNWIQKNRYQNYFYLLYHPPMFRPTNLPKTLLDIAKKRLQNVKMQFVNKDCNQKLSDLINLCDNPDTQGHWDSFCKEIQMRDSYRKNSITSIMPEIKEYMNAKV